ncbi:hypothetical protein LG299_12540 [Microbacterium lacus]|uniref:hypothetical protein n=1 Tax=Microbacterium lacus TaxID=415217 RepID=UPI00384CDD09
MLDTERSASREDEACADEAYRAREVEQERRGAIEAVFEEARDLVEGAEGVRLSFDRHGEAELNLFSKVANSNLTESVHLNRADAAEAKVASIVADIGSLLAEGDRFVAFEDCMLDPGAELTGQETDEELEELWNDAVAYCASEGNELAGHFYDLVPAIERRLAAKATQVEK